MWLNLTRWFLKWKILWNGVSVCRKGKQIQKCAVTGTMGCGGTFDIDWLHIQCDDMLWPFALLSIVPPECALRGEEGQQTSLCAFGARLVLSAWFLPLSRVFFVKSPAQIKHGWLAFWSGSGFLLHTSRQQQSHGWGEICQASPLQCPALLWD